MSLFITRDKAVILALGLAAAGFFAIFCNPLSGFDPIQYDRLGFNLASGHGFSLSQSEPYLPTMFREPGYPLFLAAIYKIFGHTIRLVVFLQCLLHALTALIVYRIAGRIFSERVAFVSGVVVSLFPTLANYPSYLMSETFFTFLLSASVALFITAVGGGKFRSYLCAGVLFGMLVLTKLTSLFLPFLLVGIVLAQQKRRDIGKFMARAATLLAIVVLIVSVWSLRNKHAFNTYSLAMRGGDVMWSRAQKVDDSPREILATVSCSFSEHLGKKLFPDLVVRSDRYLYKDLDRAVEMQKSYRSKGVKSEVTDEMLKQEAFMKISRHPFRYLLYTPVEAIKMTAFSYLPFLNEEAMRVRMRSIEHGEAMLVVLKGAMRMIAYPLLALLVIGIARSLRSWGRWIVIAAVIVYFTTIYSLMDAIGRYGVPLIPFYCIFAVAAIYPVRDESL